MIKVILCDDHAVVRRGIRDTIAEAVDIQVVGEAGSYPELRELMRKSPCDVLVLDLNMPGRGGLEVLAALKEEGSTVKTLVVSMYPEDQYAMRALKAGASGYLNKGSDAAQIVAAVVRPWMRPSSLSLSTAPAPTLTSTTSPTAAPVLEPAGWRRAAELAQALARDWPALLDRTALEAAEQKMLLTQWSLDPEGQVLSLQAWARDDDSPLVWLGTMGPQAELRQPLGDLGADLGV